MAYSVRVNASPAELWQIAANPHRHHELDGSGSIGSRATGPQALHEGDTFTVQTTRYGLTYALPMRVTESVPDRVIEFHHPVGFRWRWEFQPDPEQSGASIATETFDYSHVSPLVLRFLTRMNVFAENERSILDSLQGLHARWA